MNIQRFQAATSREAMAKARAAFGDSAVILSSRATAGGFEVVATTEENLATLPVGNGAGAAHPPSSLQSASERARAASAAPAARPVERSSSVERDTETLAMSTLSFQDYVRERMLKRRKEAMEGRASQTGLAAADLDEGAVASFPAAHAAPPAMPRRSLAERASMGDLPAQQRMASPARAEGPAPILTREMSQDAPRDRKSVV